MGAAWKSVEGGCSSKTNDKVWMELGRARMDGARKSENGWGPEEREWMGLGRARMDGARKSENGWSSEEREWMRLGRAKVDGA